MDKKENTNSELTLLTLSNVTLCYIYDSENRKLFLDFCFEGDLSSVKFSPFAIVSGVDHENIKKIAEKCVCIFVEYGSIINATDKQVVEMYEEILEFAKSNYEWEEDYC